MKVLENKIVSFEGHIVGVDNTVKVFPISQKEYVSVDVEVIIDDEKDIYPCSYPLFDINDNEIDIPKVGDFVKVRAQLTNDGKIYDPYARPSLKLKKALKGMIENARTIEEQAEYAEQVKASIEERKAKRLAAIEAARNLAAQHI